ncbi:hypothetical protein RRF57_010490 [Xylaria bambusicola]|uniref:Uncharacterized protein n=1 Tax=Xylaria bambusicola TaxID=326684 RepID=A0AAN7Z9J2_9PEZI
MPSLNRNFPRHRRDRDHDGHGDFVDSSRGHARLYRGRGRDRAPGARETPAVRGGEHEVQAPDRHVALEEERAVPGPDRCDGGCRALESTPRLPPPIHPTRPSYTDHKLLSLDPPRKHRTGSAGNLGSFHALIDADLDIDKDLGVGVFSEEC